MARSSTKGKKARSARVPDELESAEELGPEMLMEPGAERKPITRRQREAARSDVRDIIRRFTSRADYVIDLGSPAGVSEGFGQLGLKTEGKISGVRKEGPGRWIATTDRGESWIVRHNGGVLRIYGAVEEDESRLVQLGAKPDGNVMRMSHDRTDWRSVYRAYGFRIDSPGDHRAFRDEMAKEMIRLYRGRYDARERMGLREALFDMDKDIFTYALAKRLEGVYLPEEEKADLRQELTRPYLSAIERAFDTERGTQWNTYITNHLAESLGHVFRDVHIPRHGRATSPFKMPSWRKEFIDGQRRYMDRLGTDDPERILEAMLKDGFIIKSSDSARSPKLEDVEENVMLMQQMDAASLEGSLYEGDAKEGRTTVGDMVVSSGDVEGEVESNIEVERLAGLFREALKPLDMRQLVILRYNNGYGLDRSYSLDETRHIMRDTYGIYNVAEGGEYSVNYMSYLKRKAERHLARGLDSIREREPGSWDYTGEEIGAALGQAIVAEIEDRLGRRRKGGERAEIKRMRSRRFRQRKEELWNRPSELVADVRGRLLADNGIEATDERMAMPVRRIIREVLGKNVDEERAIMADIYQGLGVKTIGFYGHILGADPELILRNVEFCRSVGLDYMGVPSVLVYPELEGRYRVRGKILGSELDAVVIMMPTPRLLARMRLMEDDIEDHLTAMAAPSAPEGFRINGGERDLLRKRFGVGGNWRKLHVLAKETKGYDRVGIIGLEDRFLLSLVDEKFSNTGAYKKVRAYRVKKGIVPPLPEELPPEPVIPEREAAQIGWVMAKLMSDEERERVGKEMGDEPLYYGWHPKVKDRWDGFKRVFEREVNSGELHEKREKVLRLRSGIYDPKEMGIAGETEPRCHTLEEIGQMPGFGVTRERIRQIEGKAIKKIMAQME